jgi:hypothetical protein
MVLLQCATGSQVDKDKAAALPAIRPPEGDDKGEPVVVPILLSRVRTISHVRVVMPKDLRPLGERTKLWKSLKEVKKRFPQGLVPLDPVANMNIKDESFQKLVKVCAFAGVLDAMPVADSHFYTTENQCTRGPIAKATHHELARIASNLHRLRGS